MPSWDFKWGDAVCGHGTPYDLENSGLISIPYRGYREGFIVTVKDSSNLYVSGGMLEVANIVVTLSAQATVSMGSMQADTMYYIYASVVAQALVFTVSTTSSVYVDALGAAYMTGDSTKRWLANVHTAA
jgi:hypothetical protein